MRLLQMTAAAAAALLLVAGSARAAAGPDDDAAAIQAAFENGTLAQGQQALEAAPAADGPSRRYALGIVQFLRAGEKLGQSWRHFGLAATRLTASIPFLRLPVGPVDPATVAPISYEEFRAVFATFVADVQVAEATFASLPDDPGKVRLRPGLVHLDYAGHGKPADTETAWQTYQRLNPRVNLSPEDAAGYAITFDAGDVPWFRGYCHVLSALAETLLGYDESRLFDHTAHLFFAQPKTSFPFLLERAPGAGSFEVSAIGDALAFIHLLDFPVREPARLASALEHLRKVPALSRESWRRIALETDDDREWVPNPRQTGVLPGVQVTQERIDAWLKTLEEADAILAGRKLLPFWRWEAGAAHGVNLPRVFTEPTAFDLVLWIQGAAAQPYLEKGALTDPKLWNDLQNAFGGQALGFALYFN